MRACVYVCRCSTGEPLYFVTLFPASNQGIGVKNNNNNNKMTERQSTLFTLILVICTIVELRAGVSEMTI